MQVGIEKGEVYKTCPKLRGSIWKYQFSTCQHIYEKKISIFIRQGKTKILNRVTQWITL